MRIEGFDVTYLSSYDGLPVKNHLDRKSVV